jgi:hypothetical protein
LFGAIRQDSKNGSGTANAQLLEAFDGTGATVIRIAEISRHYDACHLSLFGGIQTEVLREEVNAIDTTGKFARFLFVRIPSRPIATSDADPTPAEAAAFVAAQETLRRYAKELYTLTPRTYHLCQDARQRFHAWFREKQNEALSPGTPGVIAALLNKASAHALRLAGVLHVLQVVAGTAQSTDRISAATADAAMAIVEQLSAETAAFHETPVEGPAADALLVQQAIHQLSWARQEPIGRQAVRDASGKALKRLLTAKAFDAATAQLVRQGFGKVITDALGANGRPLAPVYQATAELHR